jgi:hypothetical protein
MIQWNAGSCVSVDTKNADYTTKVKDSHIFSETSDIKTFLSIYYPLIILKTWHRHTLIAKTMCQFISVVNIADGR